ncbi:orotidine-5'-phosphate decarboxylase [Flavobacteriaceae bacterium]|jgi:orotidine-5'-phosphate decarboxylase|nr:orotidine-5'-phosphate decarboxylase [Flavobacteriaceae bacterium]MDA7712053.1 orotidine-5'-phosphate decarboxylase [Flavobacteriaceae bacterium]MDA8900204.1 orotidine-5'-phosphate decarboxylase [Flavobacteriaceae bacterium]
MTHTALVDQIKRKQSFLCVGLDVDKEKIPVHLLELSDPIFEFSKAIIDTTAAYAVAYKPNIAFFESYGLEGWQALERIIVYLNTVYPEIFTIADAKRGDIGNTAGRYAKAFFETLNFDSITVAPYMGSDSVEPFLEFENKHTILLALTSNQGAEDFQYTQENDVPLFEKVLKVSQQWKHAERLMYVVGATKAEALQAIRKIVPDAFLLVPGVGAQGGSLADVAKAGLNHDAGLLVNSSRGILYVSKGQDFAQAAAREAKLLQQQMASFLTQKGII